MRPGQALFIVLALVVFSNYLTALTVYGIYDRIVSVSSYRVGYAALLTGIPSLIVLLGDLAAYIIASMPVVARHDGFRGVGWLLRGYVYASLPFMVLLAPVLAVGVGDVASGGVFVEAVAFIVYVWNAIVALYALYVHPVYAPYAALMAAYWSSQDAGTSGFKRLLVRNIGLIPWVFIAAFASSILATHAVGLAARVVPGLTEQLLSLETRPVAEGGWIWKWLEAASVIMPKYTTVIADVLRYVLYMSILSKLLIRKIRLKD